MNLKLRNKNTIYYLINNVINLYHIFPIRNLNSKHLLIIYQIYQILSIPTIKLSTIPIKV